MTYDASQIKILEGLEAVRKRPGMFIGDTGVGGLHQCVFEAIDNSVDEAMGGYAKGIAVAIHADGSISVEDDGRGIPVDQHKETGKSALEVVLCTLHAGGKFENKAYKVSAGLHGVGISAANAVSEWFEATVWRDGHEWFQRYHQGKPQAPVQERASTDKHGTRVRFKPDSTLFVETTQFRWDILHKRLRELAYLNRGIRFAIADENKGKSDEFKFDGGIQAYVKYLNQGHQRIHDDIVYVEKQLGDIYCEVAFQYSDRFEETILSFVNNINTRDGGTHVSGFRTALTRVLNQLAKDNGFLKEKDTPPSGDDYREGLVACINLRIPQPQFESQTKVKLTNPEVDGAVSSWLSEELKILLDKNPVTSKAIIQKALVARDAREAAKHARELVRRKSPLFSGDLPGKLADCQSKDRAKTELFIVEGDSAGGSAKQGRDRKFQAILALKGKILNVEKARLDKMLKHEEVRTIIASLGAGIGSEFDLTKLRYGKIILLVDADIDGSHIRTLLLTLLYRHMRPLVQEGHVYLACPPLYRIKKGGQIRYVHDDRALTQALLESGVESTKLEILPGPSVVAGAELKELLQNVIAIEEYANRVVNLRVPLESFLAAVRHGQVPLYRVVKGTEERYLTSDEKFSDKVEFTEFHDTKRVSAAFKAIEEHGFTASDFLKAAQDDGKPRLILRQGNESLTMSSLHELLRGLRKMAQKGIEITRYKGLGEMNPEQLWETTLNPETRKLIRITLDDTEEADSRFSVLMGDEVEPRREFIERYALDVKNLDI